ncbi:MAG TPA: hypothetical protein VGN26_10780 [Armatimonadota bacterium]
MPSLKQRSTLILGGSDDAARLAAALGEAGHDPTLVPGFGQAQVALACGGLDAAFVDLHLPESEVRETLEQLRKRWPSALVFLLAGPSDAEALARAMAFGADGALLSPVNPTEVEPLLLEAAEVRLRQVAPVLETLSKLRELNHDLMGPLQVLDMQLAMACAEAGTYHPELARRLRMMRAATDRLTALASTVSATVREAQDHLSGERDGSAGGSATCLL